LLQSNPFHPCGVRADSRICTKWDGDRAVPASKEISLKPVGTSCPDKLSGQAVPTPFLNQPCLRRASVVVVLEDRELFFHCFAWDLNLSGLAARSKTAFAVAAEVTTLTLPADDTDSRAA